MKKIITILLAFCMMIGMGSIFAGCGNKESGDVVFTLVRGTADMEGTSLVEARVSEIAKEKLGFGVKFKTVSIFNPFPYTSWLAANEDCDIFCIAFQDPSSYIKDKSVQPIDSLLTKENAPYLTGETGLPADKQAMIRSIGTDGKTYGIGVMGATFGTGGSYLFRRDTLEQVGLYGTDEGQYTDRQSITYADLDIIFAAIKKDGINPVNAAQPMYACGILGSQDFSGYFMTLDKLGSTSLGDETGALIGTDSTTVENVYKSDAYKQYINKVGEWNSKGYLHPDAATTDEQQATLFKSGKFVGGVFDVTASLKQQQEISYSTEFVQLIFNQPYYVDGPGQGLYYISSRSKRPTSAMKFIDLMSSDVELMNTLQSGVKGTHWDWADEELLIYKPTEAKPVPADNGYYGMPGIFGDHGKMGSWPEPTHTLEQAQAAKQELIDADAAVTATALENRTQSKQFKFDQSSQSARIKGLNTIIQKYSKTLSVGKGTKGTDGTWTGPGSTYAQFIKELDDAKIDLVIAENQRQLTAWLANQG